MLDRKGRRKYLNGQERRAFLRAAESEPDLKKTAFCLVLYHTGCRVSEALQLTRDRVDFTAQSLVFKTLKQRKSKKPEESEKYRSIPIPDELLNLVLTLLAVPSKSERIWYFSRVTAYRLVKEKMAASQISGSMACPKGLRHGFGVACIEAQVPLTTVQKWLGHGRLETTAIYLDVSGEEKRSLAKRVWISV